MNTHRRSVSILLCTAAATAMGSDPCTGVPVFDVRADDIPETSVSGPAIADFDGDGDPDLAYSHDLGVRIAWNAGNGSFGTWTDLPFERSGAVTAADFDGDGALDLAVLIPVRDTSWNRIDLFMGDGTGGFTTGSHVEVANQTSQGIVACDIDGDGDLDLSARSSADWGRNITVYRNDGTGTMAYDASYGMPSLYRVADRLFADADGDGVPEMIALTDRMSLLVYPNDGEGGFLEPTEIATRQPGDVFLGDSPNFSAGDIDLDGDVDLAVTHSRPAPYPDGIAIMLGDGNGGFTLADDLLPTGPEPTQSRLVDLTGDGALDVLVVDLETEELTLLEGRGDGTFEPPVVVYAGAFPWFSLMVFGDFENDGDVDVAFRASVANATRLVTLRNGCVPTQGCAPADLAEPYFAFDLMDIVAFVNAYTAQDASADLAEPFGVFDLADLNAFVNGFIGGCP